MTNKDRQHLEAAQAWLHLGSHIEADAELENISPDLRGHPEVLRVRFVIYSKAGKHEAAADIAKAITELLPDCPVAFVQMAHAFHALKRYQDAWNVLFPVADRFKNEYIVCYDVACYACRLGNLKEAWEWLERAFNLDDSEEAKRYALKDPDLEPLRLDIAQI